MFDREIRRVEIVRVQRRIRTAEPDAVDVLRVVVHALDGTRASFDDRSPNFQRTLEAIASKLPGFAHEWSGWWTGFGAPPQRGKPVVLWDRGDGGFRKPEYVKELRKALGKRLREDGFRTRGSTGWSRTEDGLASGVWIQSSSSDPGIYVNLVWDLDFPELPEDVVPARPSSARDFWMSERVEFSSDASPDTSFLPVHGRGTPDALAARLYPVVLDGMERLTGAELGVVGGPGPELLRREGVDAGDLLFRARYHLGVGQREEARTLLEGARAEASSNATTLLARIDAAAAFLSS